MHSELANALRGQTTDSQRFVKTAWIVGSRLDRGNVLLVELDLRRRMYKLCSGSRQYRYT